MWRFRLNNLLINEKDKLFVHKVHLERLLQAKTHIENKGPETPYFMKKQLSKKETHRVKEKKRCYENAILFSRLYQINNSLSPYSRSNTPVYCPAFDKKRHNFDKIEKKKEITKLNQFLFKRFLNEKSFYPVKQLLDTNDYEIYLKSIIKRQHKANPNINFATFSQFKKNIYRNYKLQRCNSAKTFQCRPIEHTRDEMCEKNINNHNNNKDNNSINPICYNKNYKSIRNRRNYNNISSSSTMPASRIGISLSRCQSAFANKSKNIHNF
jgi:hypothetical protein